MIRFNMIAATGCLLISMALADERKLIGHWPLTNDAKDTSGNNRHGTEQAVEFAAIGAAFNGRSSRIDFPRTSPPTASGYCCTTPKELRLRSRS